MHNMGDSHHTEDVAAYLQRVFTDKDIMSLPFQRYVQGQTTSGHGRTGARHGS